MNSVKPLGPWAVTCERNRAGAYNNIGADSDESDVALISCDHPRYREIQALIVAAPDLLASLRELLDWQAAEKHATPLIFLERARSAVAKAEGRS